MAREVLLGFAAMLPVNQILLGDAIEVMKSLPDNSVDAVITDPPYAIGVADWDVAIDIAEFTIEVNRVCKGFYAFFGQMPTLLDWMVAAKAERLHYLEHVTWVKRNEVFVHAKRLSRTHEDILIYSTGKLRQFEAVKGLYQDVKLPGIMFGITTIESAQRRFSYLQQWINQGSQPTTKDNHCSQKLFDSDSRMKSKSNKSVQNIDCNYSNVWSFALPFQQPGRRGKGGNIHPTEKPIEVMKRLVEMCSPIGGVVLDPFIGSGTTAIACLETGRDFIGVEKNEGYYKVALERVAQHQNLEVSEYPALEIVEPESQKTQGWKQIKLFG